MVEVYALCAVLGDKLRFHRVVSLLRNQQKVNCLHYSRYYHIPPPHTPSPPHQPPSSPRSCPAVADEKKTFISSSHYRPISRTVLVIFDTVFKDEFFHLSLHILINASASSSTAVVLQPKMVTLGCSVICKYVFNKIIQFFCVHSAISDTVVIQSSFIRSVNYTEHNVYTQTNTISLLSEKSEDFWSSEITVFTTQIIHKR